MIINLEEKLTGLESIIREELFELVDSWGRNDYFCTHDGIQIKKCEPKECYNLSNLDVSKIENLAEVFRYSMYNGDLSKWDISNVKTMFEMFSHSNFNNNSLKNWNLNSCINISNMFAYSEFKSIPPDFNFNVIKFADLVFYYNKNFKYIFNDGYPIPRLKNNFKEWYLENKSKIRDSDLTQNDLLNYFDNFKDSNELNLNKI